MKKKKTATLIKQNFKKPDKLKVHSVIPDIFFPFELSVSVLSSFRCTNSARFGADEVQSTTRDEKLSKRRPMESVTVSTNSRSVPKCTGIWETQTFFAIICSYMSLYNKYVKCYPVINI